MRAAIHVIALLCAGLAGCAEVRNLFPERVADFRNPFPERVAGYRYFFPEPDIVLVSASPELLTYEYSRLYNNDFARAVAAAERQCRHYDKRAQVVSLVAKGEDRAWAIFACR